MVRWVKIGQDWFVLPLRFSSFMTKKKQNQYYHVSAFVVIYFYWPFLDSVQNNWFKSYRDGSVIKSVYSSCTRPYLAPCPHIRGLTNINIPPPGAPIPSLFWSLWAPVCMWCIEIHVGHTHTHNWKINVYSIVMGYIMTFSCLDSIELSHILPIPLSRTRSTLHSRWCLASP